MSYGHGDLPRVVPLVSFLRRICGLQIWFDRIDGSAAKRSSELLAGAIGSRAGRSSACLRPGSSRPGARMSLKYPQSERRTQNGFEGPRRTALPLRSYKRRLSRKTQHTGVQFRP